MKTMKVKALEPTSGTYGFIAPGEVCEMFEDKALQLIERKIVEEFTGNIAAKDVLIAVDRQQPSILGKPKQAASKEEPSKAVETDPSNATVEGNVNPVPDPADPSVPDGPVTQGHLEAPKELKHEVDTKELKLAKNTKQAKNRRK